MATQDERPSTPQAKFLEELRRWRELRGMSKTAAAIAMGYSRTYVSKVESGHERPSWDFVKAADDALTAGGAIRRAWWEAGTEDAQPNRFDASSISPSVKCLLVAHEDAELIYDGRNYRTVIRRTLMNNDSAPVVQFMIHIFVDRFPTNPDLSNQLYRQEPLTWKELDLRAWHGENREEPMRWVPHHDMDAMKEVWLLFSNEKRRFPLYPGHSVPIEYSYIVSDQKWGNWFQRAMRLPTNLLTIRLNFPADVSLSVWGVQASMHADLSPFHTAIEEKRVGSRRVFSWSTEQPALHARYRMEWEFQ